MVLIEIIKKILKDFNEIVESLGGKNSNPQSIGKLTLKVGFNIAQTIIKQIGGKSFYLFFFFYLIYFNIDAFKLKALISDFNQNYNLNELSINYTNENDFYTKLDELDLKLRPFKDKFFISFFAFVLLFYVPKLTDLEIMKRVRVAFKIGSYEILLTLFSICTWVLALVVINVMLFSDELSEIENPIYSKIFQTITLNNIPEDEELSLAWVIKLFDYVITSVAFF